MRSLLVIGCAAIVASCGGKTDGGHDEVIDSGTSVAIDSGSPVVVDSYVAPPDVAPEAVADAVDDAACEKFAEAIGALIVDTRCTTSVRVSTTSGALIGWSVACGRGPSLDEAAARALFAPHVAPSTKVEDYFLMPGSMPNEELIFYKSASDWGGTGVVSGLTGQLVYVDEAMFAEPIAVTYPSTWRSPSEAPAICTPSALPGTHAISRALPVDVPKATNAIAPTPLARAIGRGGHGILTSVFAFVGPPSDEILVFLNSALIR